MSEPITDHRRAIVRAALRRRKLKLKAAGLCQDCGYTAPFKGRTLCGSCLMKRRDRGAAAKLDRASSITQLENAHRQGDAG